jgi:hypothetical protein
MKKKSPTITQTMTNSPGGIQTGRDVNIKTEIPPPEISAALLFANKPANGMYETRVRVTVKSQAALMNLYLRVDAPSIVSLEVISEVSTMLITGHSATRDGWAFTNVPNANGAYQLIIIAKNKERCEVTYDYQ